MQLRVNTLVGLVETIKEFTLLAHENGYIPDINPHFQVPLDDFHFT